MISAGQNATIRLLNSDIDPNNREAVKESFNVLGCEPLLTGADSPKVAECKTAVDAYLGSDSVTQIKADVFVAGTKYCGRAPDVRYTFAEDSAECMKNFLGNLGNYKQGQTNIVHKRKPDGTLEVVALPSPHGILDLSAAATTAEMSAGTLTANQTTAAEVLNFVAAPLPPPPPPNQNPGNQQQSANTGGGQQGQGASGTGNTAGSQPAADIIKAVSVEWNPSFDNSNRSGLQALVAASIPLSENFLGRLSLSLDGDFFYWRMPVLQGSPEAALRKDYFGGDHWTDIHFYLRAKEQRGDTTHILDFGNVDRDYYLFPGFGGKYSFERKFSEQLKAGGSVFLGTGWSNPIDYQGNAATFADGGLAWSAGASAEYNAHPNATGTLSDVPLSFSLTYAPAGRDMEGMPDFLGINASAAVKLKVSDRTTVTPSLAWQLRLDTANDRDRNFFIAGINTRRARNRDSAWLVDLSLTRYLGSRSGDHTNISGSSNDFDDPATGTEPGNGIPDMSVGQDAWEARVLPGYAEGSWSLSAGLMWFKTEGFLGIGDETTSEDTASETFGVVMLKKTTN